MKKLLLFSLTIAFVYGCSQKEDPCCSEPVRFTETYSRAFLEPANLHCTRITYGFEKSSEIIKYGTISKYPDIFTVEEGIQLIVYVQSEGNIAYFPEIGSMDIYNSYAKLMGDTSFNEYVGGTYTNLYISETITEEMEYILITCDKDWDEAHPAGSSLNDLFVMYYEDHYALVQNGYKAPAGTYKFSAMEHQVHPQAVVESPGPEFSALNSPFIGSEWIFHLIAAPARTDTYSFTITANFANGVEASTTTEYPATIAAAE